MKKIRVFLADDHAVLRAGLRLLVETQSDMEVVGEAGNAAETSERVRAVQPDVMVLDLSMPGTSGVRLVEQLVREIPDIRVLVLTMHDDVAYMRMAIAAGAAGYMVKKSADTDLLSAIRAIAAGRMFTLMDISTKSATTPEPDFSPGGGKRLEELSEREREVLLFVARGFTNQAIADKLFLSVKTVESYRARMMQKLGLTNRAELTRFAVDLGLLPGSGQTPA